MISFYMEPGYDVKKPEREFGNAGIDFFIPNYTDTFAAAFNDKNVMENASLFFNEELGWHIYIKPHGRVNIPSGVRSRISSNIALEAQNKSGVATKHGLVYGASTVDASYTGIIHLSLINSTKNEIRLPLGSKIVQFIPRLIDTSDIEICDNMTLAAFYEDFEFSNRGEGAFGSTGV